MCSADIFLGLLAVLFPPLAVWVKRGICSADSIINILLCVLGYIPGLIHAWYIIAKYPEESYEYEHLPQHDREGNPVYVYVHDVGAHGRRGPQRQPKPHDRMSYGTTGAPAAGPPRPQQQQQQVPHAAENGGEGSSNGNTDGAPPSYAQVVAGDHKVQTQD